jgi:cytidine deaminase
MLPLPMSPMVVMARARRRGGRSFLAHRPPVCPHLRSGQVLVDHHPGIRVIVPTPEGPRSVPATDLLPHAYQWRERRTPRLRFRGTHLDAVRAGTKRCTVRFRDPVQVGPALLVFELPEPVSLPGRVTSTVATRVSDITEEDARADGFASAGDVLPGPREYYPDLRADDEVVLVRFTLDG